MRRAWVAYGLKVRGQYQQGGLLISALIVLTLILVLAAGSARIQMGRADLVGVLAQGSDLLDLVQTGEDLLLYELYDTVCHFGVSPDAQGRTTFNRSVEGSGTLLLTLCPLGAACYPTDWTIIGQNPDWAGMITATIGSHSRTVLVGIAGDCSLPTIPRLVWDKPVQVSVADNGLTLRDSGTIDCSSSSACLQANGQSGSWKIPGKTGDDMVLKGAFDMVPPSGGRLQVDIILDDGAAILCDDQLMGGGVGFAMGVGADLYCHHSADGSTVTTICDGTDSAACNLGAGALALNLGHFDPNKVVSLTVRIRDQLDGEQTRLSSVYLGTDSPGNYDLFSFVYWR
ncbi:MAG: hypothetical protein HQL67_08575 [Magnetococcales bacterium]|nr:hypothetical protein [Magnetococcales bacterium]